MGRPVMGEHEHPNVTRIRATYDAVGRGDVEAFAAALADDVLWHESMPGFEGDYHGRDAAIAMLGSVFASGIEVNRLSIERVFADDTRAVVLVEVAVTVSGREHVSRYADVYHIVDGLLAEHWHLPYDHRAEEAFFGS